VQAPPQRPLTGESFKQPLLWVIVLALIFLMTFLGLLHKCMQAFSEQVEIQRRQNLVQLVSVARHALEPILEKLRSGAVSADAARQQVRDLLRSMTYSDQYGKNYIFMSAYDGTMLVQPFEPQKELTDQWNLQDAHGRYIIRELVRTARDCPEGGFVRYHYHLPGVHGTQEKLAFVRGIPELSAYVGTGMYLQQSFREQAAILRRTHVGAVVLVILVLVPIIIAAIAVHRRNRRLLSEIQTRRRAEEELSRSEEKYRLLTENMQDVIWQATPDLVFTYVSQSVEPMFGFPPDAIVGQTVFDFLTPGSREFLAAQLDQTGDRDHRLSGQMYELEFQRRDGSTIWAEVLSSPLHDGDGLLTGFQGITRDITERQRHAAALRESELKFRTLFENSADGIFIMTDRFLDCNDQAGKIFHCGREDLIGRAPVDFSPPYQPDGRPSVDAARIYYEAALVGGPQLFSWQHRRPDGTDFDAEVSVSLFLMGGQRLLQVTVRDVTARKQTAEELARARASLEAAINASPAGIVIADAPDVRIRVVNQAALHIRGKASEPLIDIPLEQHAKNWQIFHPSGEAYAPEDLPVSRAVLTGEVVENELAIIRRTSGEDRWILVNASPIRNTAGDIVGGVGVFLDITERRQSEEDRLEMQRRLLHAQKLESLGILAGGIAHDFNNLIMAIIGNLDLACLELPPQSPVGHYLEQSLHASRRAADLTRQMLAYSGKGKFLIEDIDLNDLVQQNVHLFQTVMTKSVHFHLALTPHLPPIRVDAGQVQQVIMNLITNATEAIGGTPGMISLTTGLQDCDAACLENNRFDDRPSPGRFVFLEVADSGCGMDAETLQRLFDPFFTTKFTGRGLGMAAVLGIMRGHGGAIFVESAPGRGTAIRVLFPAAGDQPLPAPEPGGTPAFQPRELLHTEPLTILLVDDEPEVLEVCRGMLERLGFQVLTARDGREAVELFRSHADEIACVLLDLTMPTLDGVMAFQEMRRWRPEGKVILSSGYNEQEVTQRFTGLGLAGFIQKPYRMHNLQEELQRVLEYRIPLPRK